MCTPRCYQHTRCRGQGCQASAKPHSVLSQRPFLPPGLRYKPEQDACRGSCLSAKAQLVHRGAGRDLSAGVLFRLFFFRDVKITNTNSVMQRTIMSLPTSLFKALNCLFKLSSLYRAVCVLVLISTSNTLTYRHATQDQGAARCQRGLDLQNVVAPIHAQRPGRPLCPHVED